MDLIPGQEYSFIIDRLDPAFGEGDSNSFVNYANLTDDNDDSNTDCTSELLSQNDGTDCDADTIEEATSTYLDMQWNNTIFATSINTANITIRWQRASSTAVGATDADFFIYNSGTGVFDTVTSCQNINVNIGVWITYTCDITTHIITQSDANNVTIKINFYTAKDKGGGGSVVTWIDYAYYSLDYTGDITAPATITNLNNQSQGGSWIYWNWTNPVDTDFNHTEVWINGTFYANVSTPDNFYNATGLFSDTSYQIQTRTVDNDGNINYTWINDTSKTLPGPDLAPPGHITNLDNQSQGFNWIYWNWTNPVDTDFNHTEVWINGTFYANVSTPDNFYNATGLFSDTSYQIQTRTVDNLGNVRTDWVNDDAKTLFQDMISPIINWINDTPDIVLPNELINFTANVTDNVEVDTVLVEILGTNHSMDGSVAPGVQKSVLLYVSGDTGDCTFSTGTAMDSVSSNDYRSLFLGTTCGWDLEDWILETPLSIDNIEVFIEHVGEDGIDVGSTTLFVGNSTSTSLYGTTGLSDFESINKLYL